jgi:hypothetical protein
MPSGQVSSRGSRLSYGHAERDQLRILRCRGCARASEVLGCCRRPRPHVGLALWGTALTSQQATLLSQAANLPTTGILLAFDSDAAGRKATIRAYGILRPHSATLQTVHLSGKAPVCQRYDDSGLR